MFRRRLPGAPFPLRTQGQALRLVFCLSKGFSPRISGTSKSCGAETAPFFSEAFAQLIRCSFTSYPRACRVSLTVLKVEGTGSAADRASETRPLSQEVFPHFYARKQKSTKCKTPPPCCPHQAEPDGPQSFVFLIHYKNNQIVLETIRRTKERKGYSACARRILWRCTGHYRLWTCVVCACTSPNTVLSIPAHLTPFVTICHHYIKGTFVSLLVNHR